MKIRQELGTNQSHVIPVIRVSDMLNNFCFHVYAQKSLFIGENDNVNVYFWTAAAALSCEFRVH